MSSTQEITDTVLKYVGLLYNHTTSETKVYWASYTGLSSSNRYKSSSSIYGKTQTGYTDLVSLINEDSENPQLLYSITITRTGRCGGGANVGYGNSGSLYIYDSNDNLIATISLPKFGINSSSNVTNTKTVNLLDYVITTNKIYFKFSIRAEGGPDDGYGYETIADYVTLNYYIPNA